MTKMSKDDCAGFLSVHLKYWLENGNYDYDFNKYNRDNNEDVLATYLKNNLSDFNMCFHGDYVINSLKYHFTKKLNEEIEKFMEHKNKNDNPDKLDEETGKHPKYEFKILFNPTIKKDKIISELEKKHGIISIGKKVKFGEYLPTKLDSVVEDIKNDKDLSDEKIFNLIICLIDINEYYKLDYDYKKIIKEILSKSPVETNYLIWRHVINEDSLTKYVSKKYTEKYQEYKKYLTLIFAEAPAPSADGRRSTKRRKSKRRSSKRRSSKRRSKKSKSKRRY